MGLHAQFGLPNSLVGPDGGIAMSPGKTLRSVHLGNPGPESVDELARFVGRRAAERLWSDGRCLDGAVFTGEEIMRFAEPLG